MTEWKYSGSYDPQDTIFLMRPVEIAETAIEKKERLIQSGQRHYSEMITREKPPQSAYLELFHQAMRNNAARFADDLLTLSREIRQKTPDSITLVSLARAGTPVGALLTRHLRRTCPEVQHFSISIIRDRGIDTHALQYILDRRPKESIIFIDGWTGKGVMCRELRKSVQQAHLADQLPYQGKLVVLADLCGEAGFAATNEDYLIPSSLLGATISGLVSRSIRNTEVVGPGEFDACLEYSEFRQIDMTRTFVDQISQLMLQREDENVASEIHSASTQHVDNSTLQKQRSTCISDLMHEFHVTSENYVKPGICESTRVLLRRMPQVLLLRNGDDVSVQHLINLARERNTRLVIREDLPWEAAALIARTS